MSANDDSKLRLDQKVVELIPGLSRKMAAQLIEEGQVAIAGRVQLKPGMKIKTSDQITVDYDESQLYATPDIKIPILFQDQDCLVIDKPPGLLTHSKGSFNPEATVATFIKPFLEGVSGERAGIVHRLDRATSGVMICSRNEVASKWLQKQFSSRKVKKTYIAIVKGEVETPEALIDMPIERNPKHPQTFRVGLNGRQAKTRYRVIKKGNGITMLELTPETGRTHQLRVHLSQIGHPILGDKLYDDQIDDRLYLHALRLELTLPSREHRVFEAKLPTEFHKRMKL